MLDKIIADTLQAVPEVLPYLSPSAQLYVRSRQARKAEGDLTAINKAYNDEVVQALIDYFEGGRVAASRNAFKRAMIQAFGDSYDLGHVDGGGELPVDDDSMAWLEARLNQEAGYIDTLFEQAKMLRKEEDFDYFAWATTHAGNYVNTLREIYNTGRLRAMQDQMVTFDGDDGVESCPDCQRLKGKRHKISWFIARDYVPPFGRGLECHPGRRCQHGLLNDKGEWVTV